MGCCCKDSSCEANKPKAETPCPRCGVVGRPVGDETLRAILKAGAAESLLGVERRFCRTQSCEVLYYGEDGRFVEKSAATVRVGAKETEDPVPLCYCFNHTLADIRREVQETGSSTVADRIAAEIRADKCECEVKNPSGACCLGEVRKATKEVQEAIAGGERQPGSASPKK